MRRKSQSLITNQMTGIYRIAMKAKRLTHDLSQLWEQLSVKPIRRTYLSGDSPLSLSLY